MRHHADPSVTGDSVIESLDIRGFRNIESTSLHFESGSHLVLGDNGAGKTSLLEAIYALSTSRSFRAPRLADCVRHDFTGFALGGDTVERQRLELVFEGQESHRRLNGSRSSLSDYLSTLPIVSWTAPDLDILVGPPQARRRFLDRGVVGLRPAAIALLGRYRQTLAAKRRLLQAGAANDRQQLETWNELLAAVAAELIAHRARYVEQLENEIAVVLERCDLGLPAPELRYRPSPREGLGGADAILGRLRSDAEKEMLLEKPLHGPHRDDLSIRFRGHPLRFVASAGERKAIGLALVAAHGLVLENAGQRPIYLLDDVDIELDPTRLAALWRFFAQSRQIMVTSNRPTVWRDLSINHRWRACDGLFKKV